MIHHPHETFTHKGSHVLKDEDARPTELHILKRRVEEADGVGDVVVGDEAIEVQVQHTWKPPVGEVTRGSRARTHGLGKLANERRSRLETKVGGAYDSAAGGIWIRYGDESVELRGRKRSHTSQKCLGSRKSSRDTPTKKAMKRQSRVVAQERQHRREGMVTHATTQQTVPGRRREATKDAEERVGSGQSEETPQVGESEEGKVAKANRQPGPLGGESRAEVSRTNNAGAHDMVRRYANDETTTKGGPPEPGPTQT